MFDITIENALNATDYQMNEIRKFYCRTFQLINAITLTHLNMPARKGGRKTANKRK